MWNPLNETLSCTCRKFESFGILCRHGLKVFDVLDIKLIPNRYIMKRWRRDAKDGRKIVQHITLSQILDWNM